MYYYLDLEAATLALNHKPGALEKKNPNLSQARKSEAAIFHPERVRTLRNHYDGLYLAIPLFLSTKFFKISRWILFTVQHFHKNHAQAFWMGNKWLNFPSKNFSLAPNALTTYSKKVEEIYIKYIIHFTSFLHF